MAIPRWRYVRYTDDGSALYQCLNCYCYWDARTEPGYFEKYLKTDALVQGGWTLSGDGVRTYYAKRAEPAYRENWKFCPYCGVNWEGVVPHDCSECDNEHMLGDRRLKIERLIRKRSNAISDSMMNMNWMDREKIWGDTWRAPPHFWWVIQERHDDGYLWEDKEYAYGGLMPAKKMLYFLRERQVQIEADNMEVTMHGFGRNAAARLIARRGALPKPKGYEITNYEPIEE